MRADRKKITAAELSGAVIVSTLTPFDQHGGILFNATSDQAHRLAQIDGVKGIAVNINARERHILTTAERLEIIRRTRARLNDNHLLLACVGELSDSVIEDVANFQDAGADAVIATPPKWQKKIEDTVRNKRIDALADLIDRLPLPVIVALDNAEVHRPAISDEIVTLAQHSQQVIGFALGADHNALYYDQDHCALKAIERPLSCQPSSEGALFHSLNTGADGLLSFLASVAPHEVAALYHASRIDHFHEAQALHNRLSPLFALLSGLGQHTSEMIYREAAHYRGLLASPHARDISTGLCGHLKQRLHQVIDEIDLKPIRWV